MNYFIKHLKKNPVIGDQYKLLKLVDTGTQGAVFKAENINNGDTVAIKVLLNPNDKENNLESKNYFLTGAKLSQDLDHPNLVKIIDAGEDKKWGVFLVMEYLKGINLSKKISKTSHLPEKTILVIAKQLASVISYIHEKHMLHGDIKPENIFLEKKKGSRKTFIKLLDFLPKRRLSDWIDFELTPEYLSPEIFAGKHPGPELDLFAIGVLLFELITGTLPTFRNNGSLQFPNSKSKISSELTSILEGLLSFKPEIRIKTVKEQLLNTTNVVDNKPPLDSLSSEFEIVFSSKSSSGEIELLPENLRQLLFQMVSKSPLPQILLNRDTMVIYLNNTALDIFGEKIKYTPFTATPLALNAPIILNDIRDSFELTEIRSRNITLDGINTSIWTVPVVISGIVLAVQVILSPNINP